LIVTDKARPSGTADWLDLSQIREVAAYAPPVQEKRADDVAEALEPVELEMSYKRQVEDEDQDVDMIPLIDVSLVLLIFFMMTSTVSGLSSTLSLPEVRSAPGGLSSDQLWVSVEKGGDQPDAPPVYAVGIGNASAKQGDRNLDLPTAMQRLDDKLATLETAELVTVRGHKDLETGVIKELRAQLEVRRKRGQIRKIGDEVVEKPSS
jgi:biopolymer transport protein ExbD